MVFHVDDAAYDSFMGRYSKQLASLFADFAGVSAGSRVLDVGAGAGALAAELSRRLGAERVAAAEPSPEFVVALCRRLPGVHVREAPAEALPWEDGTFDAALAQLVISFVADAPGATAELRRVVRAGGVVAMCMWDDDGLELSPPLRAAREAAAPEMPPPPRLPFRSEAALVELLRGAGLRSVETASMGVESEYESFDEFWGVAVAMTGPDTAWMRSVDDERLSVGREAAREFLGSPSGAFVLKARAAAVKGLVPD